MLLDATQVENSDLVTIEKELQALLDSQDLRWQRIVQLLLLVQREELYRRVAPSFTAWVKIKASEFKIHESNFWRILNAGKYYISIQESYGLTDLMQACVTPEQLELVKKINSIAPEALQQQLLEKLKKGKLNRQELRETWEIYRPVKEGQTERGRKPESPSVPASSREYFSEDFSIYEQQGAGGEKEREALGKEKRLLLTEANIAEALRRDQHWPFTIEDEGILAGIQEESEDNSRLALSERVRNICFKGSPPLEVVLLKKQPALTLPLIYGIKIKASLEAGLQQMDLSPYLSFCHYLYIALPQEEYLVKEALAVYPAHIGILSVSEQQLIVLQRPARHLSPDQCDYSYGVLLNAVIKWHNY